MVPSRDQSLGQHFIRVVRISHDDKIATYGEKVTLQEPYVVVCEMCERNRCVHNCQSPITCWSRLCWLLSPFQDPGPLLRRSLASASPGL